MAREEIVLLAVGEVLIDREVPESIFVHTASLLRTGDITFAHTPPGLRLQFRVAEARD